MVNVFLIHQQIFYCWLEVLAVKFVVMLILIVTTIFKQII